MNTLLLLKDYTLANMFIAELRLVYKSEMLFQLITFQKVQLYAMLNNMLVILANLPELQEHSLSLLDTVKMDLKQELNYHQELEKLLMEIQEPWLELLQLEEELKNQF